MASALSDLSILDQPESWPDLEATVAEWLNGYDPRMAGVVVPIFNALTDVLACIDSLGHTTPKEVPVLLIDDASTEVDLPSAVAKAAKTHGFLYVRKPQNSGFVNTVNLAFAWFQPRDVVIVNSDTIFPNDWCDRLRAAAYSHPNVATATPLTNHGTIVTIPHWTEPQSELTNDLTLQETDERIRQASRQRYPPLPTAVGHCVYIRRQALDAVGFFDQTFAPGYGEEVDFSQRAIMAGLINVAADDLFIQHTHNRSFSQLGRGTTAKLQQKHHPILEQRYPWYYEQIRQLRSVPETPLLQAIANARGALIGLHVAIDLTGLGDAKEEPLHRVCQLISTLTEGANSAFRVSFILDDEVQTAEFALLSELVGQHITVSHLLNTKSTNPPPFDLLHRPLPLLNPDRFEELSRYARRCILALPDPAAYRQPHLHLNADSWIAHQRVVEWIVRWADGLIAPTAEAESTLSHFGLIIPTERLRLSTDVHDETLLPFYHALLELPKRSLFSNRQQLTAAKTNELQSAHVPLSLPKQIRRGLHILRHQGLPSLTREVCQYIQWRFHS